MTSCVRCGLALPSGKLCRTCSNYIKRGGVWHVLPPHGVVAYDIEGRPICHICGMSFNKLIEHTKRKHGLDTVAYRNLFGLMVSARLTGPEYHAKMQQHAVSTKTYIKNFETTHSGETRHITGRTPGWSVQETEARRGVQSANGSMSKKNLSPARMERLGKIWEKNLPKR